MSEITELIERVEKIIARPVIPVEQDLWDSAHVGAFLKRSPKHVTQRYAAMPTFPKAIRLPSTGKGRADPLWRAKDVIAWAERYFEKA